MTDHATMMAAPRVHAPFPSNALTAGTGTQDVRLGTGGVDTDRSVQARKAALPQA